MFSVSGRSVILFNQYKTSLLADFIFFISSLGKGRGEHGHLIWVFRDKPRSCFPSGKECIWYGCEEHLFFTSNHLLQRESHQGRSTVIICSTMKSHHQQDVWNYLVQRRATNHLLTSIEQWWIFLHRTLLVVSKWPGTLTCNYFSLTHIQKCWDRESLQMLIMSCRNRVDSWGPRQAGRMEQPHEIQVQMLSPYLRNN